MNNFLNHRNLLRGNKKIPSQIYSRYRHPHEYIIKFGWGRPLGQTLFVLLLSLIFLVSFVSAIPQTFNVHGRLSNSTGVLTGTYEMNFSLYDVYSGGSYLWNDNYSVTTNSDGVYNIILTNIDLPFSAQYYLGVAVVGNGNFFKPIILVNFEMSPSDPSGSLDDFFLGGIYG